MKRIGITGQSGFIGSHLYNYISLNEEFELVTFEKTFFSDNGALQQFVQECDAIVHLAAVNRHEDAQVLYDTNVELVEKLISACKNTSSIPHILISSSTQETRDNLYGQSKKRGRELLEEWSEETGALVSGMIIPNVFGPFGQPNYNSVVATFCHKVVQGETPTVINDGLLNLIYVNDLVHEISELILNSIAGKVEIAPRHSLYVTELLKKIESFKELYLDKGEFPPIEDYFDLSLFNTFRCYVPHNHYPCKFVNHEDARGNFVEIVRANTSGQFSFSTTKPGVTRGNHFHTRKAERFAVIQGKAKIQLRKINTSEVVEYELDGKMPSYVDMPIWYIHNIKNIGDGEMVALFWINEAYDPQNADTYFEIV